MLHYLLIRYIIRILIFPLANPIIKSFFTTFYLDDYIKLLDLRLKNYHNAIKIGNEEAELNSIQIVTIKEKLLRYNIILKEISLLIEKLDLKLMRKPFAEKIHKIVDLFEKIIYIYSERLIILNKLKENIDLDKDIDAQKNNFEGIKILADQYIPEVDKLYEIFSKNISILDYLRLFLGTKTILDFFKELLKIDNPESACYFINDNEM